MTHLLNQIICAIVLSFLLLWQNLADGQASFINIGQEQKLSSLKVTSLFQDIYGFVWIGTSYGLNRFDGYDCVPYFNIPSDTTSLSSNYISPHAFAEDELGNLWIATYRGGLNCLHRNTERFISYHARPDQPNSLSMNKLFAIEPDGKGGLWIATAGRGLNHYDPHARSFEVLDADDKRPELLMGSTVTSCLKLSRAGDLWIGTNKGVCRFKPKKRSFEYFPFIAGLDQSLSDGFVTAIEEDDYGNIWIGTAHGLNRWDAAKGVFIKYYFEFYSSQNAPGYNYILDIRHDDEGNLWLGTNAGLLCFNISNGIAIRFQHEPDNPFSIHKGPVNTVMRDRDGNIWVGTNNGISILNKDGAKLHHQDFWALQSSCKSICLTEGINALLELSNALLVATQTGLYRYEYRKVPKLISSGNFTALLYDSNSQVVYAGTNGDGVYVLDAAKGNPILHLPKSMAGDPTTPFKVYGQRVNSLTKDCYGYIWIATDACINRYHPATRQIQKFFDVEKKLKNSSSNSNLYLMSDRQGNLWIASMGGLSRLAKEELGKPLGDTTLHFEHFLHQASNTNCISSDVVFCLLESSGGQIWAGTEAGLNCFNPKNGRWTWYLKKDGLPDNEIIALVEDRNRNIWAATTHGGLAKLDFQNSRIYRYSQKSGLNTDQFRPNAGIYTSNGLVVFGGLNGLAGFHPDSLVLEKYQRPAPVYFTGFSILNEPVPIGPKCNQLKVPIFKNPEIELDYNRKVFTVQVSSLNFTNPEAQIFRHRLDPFQHEWQYDGDKREITFTNLDPGVYQLRVESSENGYDWTGQTLSIRIHPPLYRRWWAYLLYALVFLSIGLAVRHYELKRQHAKAEAQKLHELDLFKTRFYTNITHEFRTPLTVIIGLSENLKTQADASIKTGLEMIRRNGRQVLHLVNQMLTLAKAESGHLKPAPIQGDIVFYIKYLLESFHSLAEAKKIRVHFQANPGVLPMDYDQDWIKLVVSNLLSNALKFTQQGGAVWLTIEEVKSQHGPTFQMIVQDNGQGIAPEKLPYVFERFYQADDTATRSGEGSGIGLALVKELVKLMDGQIRVASEPDKGTTFTINLPIYRIAKPQQEVPTILDLAIPPDQFLMSKPAFHPQKSDKPTSKDKPLVLLIEDNMDVVHYLHACLRDCYQIQIATNGEQGIAKALELIPDLVVSDVMMPIKDGFEVCHTLKTEERTSHIPIILLTAKADIQSKLIGLRQGADAYLSKPFERDELLARIANLLEIRRNLHEHYLAAAGLGIRAASEKVQGVSEASPEHAFVLKIKALIEADFSAQWPVHEIAQRVYLDPSQVYRKLKAVTGMHTTEFVRSVRLSKARELLIDRPDEKISAIADEVGFNTIYDFNRRFKELYGMTPGAWRAQNL